MFFCIGLAATFTTLGATSALFGRLMTGAGIWWYIVLGLIMSIMASQMLGIFNIMPQTCKVPNKRKGLLGAFVLGILGGVLYSPCATPVLAAILAFVAGQAILHSGLDF